MSRDGRNRGNRQPGAPRERLLDAAYALVEDGDWESLRLAQVARLAGASRQTAYNEFGSKVGLGRALVEREIGLLVGGVQERMDRHLDDLPAAVEAAVGFVIDEGRRRTLLRSILGASRYPDDELIALATRGQEPVLTEVIAALRGYADSTWPAVPAGVKDLLVESLVRLTVSHVVAPLGEPAAAARDLGSLTRLLAAPAPGRADG
ncbi:TetR family transcriptional regulator [Actinomadura sp. 7K507]|uniref:TetR family transcriptional regulator n=1 Tax=Actinomadura sp. 7K507 TaxID=2530365 RepID=UPI0014045F0F|nr:TetR family transcriptional regulator [Actinomadura sp. 7K507]